MGHICFIIRYTWKIIIKSLNYLTKSGFLEEISILRANSWRKKWHFILDVSIFPSWIGLNPKKAFYLFVQWIFETRINKQNLLEFLKRDYFKKPLDDLFRFFL